MRRVKHVYNLSLLFDFRGFRRLWHALGKAWTRIPQRENKQFQYFKWNDWKTSLPQHDYNFGEKDFLHFCNFNFYLFEFKSRRDEMPELVSIFYIIIQRFFIQIFRFHMEISANYLALPDFSKLNSLLESDLSIHLVKVYNHYDHDLYQKWIHLYDWIPAKCFFESHFRRILEGYLVCILFLQKWISYQNKFDWWWYIIFVFMSKIHLLDVNVNPK